MDFIELSKRRYSVRSYQDTPVEKEKILQILEAARMAPSACNLQPLKFIVITDPNIMNSITTEVYSGKWLQSAPVIIAVCGDHSNSWKRRDGKDHGDIDVAIAIDHLTLAAADLGLGTCWICAFQAALCHKLLELEDHYEVIALIPLGYPADDAIPAKNRKAMEEIVSWR
jgi:nitroreductase